MANKIRCACGLSNKMPWCDGSHQDESWFCQPKLKAHFNRAIYANVGLDNLSKRLAWRFDAQHLRYGEKAAGKTLVIIDDGSNLSQTKHAIADFDFEQLLYIGLDFNPQAIAQALRIERYIQINDSITNNFIQLEQQLEPWFNQGELTKRPTKTAEKPQPRQIFISHAVADEALLLPAVESLRQLTEQQVFLCFDSIKSGGKWRREIDTALQQSELFIAIISENSVKSTYCAYEIGFAQALQKPLMLISIDGTLPPPFVSHIHCIDLCREIAAKPWLDLPSALQLHLLSINVK